MNGDLWLLVVLAGLALVGGGFGLAVRVRRDQWRRLTTLRGVVAAEREALLQAQRLVDAFLVAREQLRRGRQG